MQHEGKDHTYPDQSELIISSCHDKPDQCWTMPPFPLWVGGTVGDCSQNTLSPFEKEFEAPDSMTGCCSKHLTHGGTPNGLLGSPSVPFVWVCFCLCVCLWVRQAFRISTSEDNVNESWLPLFLFLLLPFFHPEASSRNLKAAIRVTRRSTGIKDTKIVFVFLAESFGKLYNLMFNLNFTPLWSNKWQYNRSLVGTQTYEWTN